MDFAEFWEYARWSVVAFGAAMLYKLECWLILLAKRHLPRGSKIRRIVLLSRANEPD